MGHQEEEELSFAISRKRRKLCDICLPHERRIFEVVSNAQFDIRRNFIVITAYMTNNIILFIVIIAV